ncbi:hypothetical protein [Veronia nyctiphanis]|uniref:hypothetical protein n=1 Tax=Veronia nyctiphanis TaxID=1278244 RepID=UPI001F2CD7D2|nr:hypothetical protein [Veronia nyctiphanis]
MLKKSILILLAVLSPIALANNSKDDFSRSIQLKNGSSAASVYGNTAVVGNHLYGKENGYWKYKKVLPVGVTRLALKKMSQCISTISLWPKLLQRWPSLRETIPLGHIGGNFRKKS